VKIYGLKVAEGTTVQNLCVPHGSVFPSDPSDGEMFLMLKNDNSLPVLFVYVVNEWKSVTVTGLGKAQNQTQVINETTLDTNFTNLKSGQNLIYDGTVWVNKSVPGFTRSIMVQSGTVLETNSYIGIRHTDHIEIALPLCENGKVFIFKDELGNASKWPITIIPHNTNTIDLKSSITITSNFNSLTLIMGQNNWSII
jgi:hypothetical protein